MRLFTLSAKKRRQISKGNVVVYSYDYRKQMGKEHLPAKNRKELLIRKLFLD